MENISITHLFRSQHSTVSMLFFWYADVLVPHLQRFDSCSLKLQYLYSVDNCFLMFFGNKMFEQYFAVQNIYVSQSVGSFKKAILCPKQQNSSKEGCCFLRKETYTSLQNITLFFLADSCMTHIQHAMKKSWYSFEQICSC